MSEQHLFSSGTLYVNLPVAVSAVSLVSQTGVVTSAPNLIDKNPSTTGTITYVSGGGSPGDRACAFLDLGSAQPVQMVRLLNLTVSGAQSVSFWLTDDATWPTDGVGAATGSGAGSLASVSLTDGTTVPEVILHSNLAQTHRYVAIALTGAAPFLTIGDITIFGADTPFAVVQDAQIDMQWSSKELYNAAQVSDFPIDVGFADAKWTVKIGNAGIRADTLQQLIAAALTGTSTLTNSIASTIQMPSMRSVFTAYDTTGKTVTFTLNSTRAKGVSLPFKLTDFVVQNFELEVFPDFNGVMGTIVFGS